MESQCKGTSVSCKVGLRGAVFGDVLQNLNATMNCEERLQYRRCKKQLQKGIARRDCMFQGTIAEGHGKMQNHDAVQNKIVEYNCNFKEHCGRELKLILNAENANGMFTLTWADVIWDIAWQGSISNLDCNAIAHTSFKMYLQNDFKE